MHRLSNSLRLLAEFRRDERGISAVEFALVLPVMLLLAVGLTEMGRVVNQAATVEKSLRAGALFAARNQFPLTSAIEQTVENIVKTGDPAGGKDFLVPGWAKGGANFTVKTVSFDLEGMPLPVVQAVASVPFVPMLPGMLPFPTFNIELRHEQAYIGN